MDDERANFKAILDEHGRFLQEFYDLVASACGEDWDLYERILATAEAVNLSNAGIQALRSLNPTFEAYIREVLDQLPQGQTLPATRFQH